jgi:hypothetical protein
MSIVQSRIYIIVKECPASFCRSSLGNRFAGDTISSSGSLNANEAEANWTKQASSARRRSASNHDSSPDCLSTSIKNTLTDFSTVDLDRPRSHNKSRSLIHFNLWNSIFVSRFPIGARSILSRRKLKAILCHMKSVITIFAHRKFNNHHFTPRRARAPRMSCQEESFVLLPRDLKIILAQCC